MKIMIVNDDDNDIQMEFSSADDFLEYLREEENSVKEETMNPFVSKMITRRPKKFD